MFTSSRFSTRPGLVVACVCAVSALAFVSLPQAQGQVPAVLPLGARVAYSQATSGTSKKSARDAAGNLFFLDTTPQIYEIPVSGPEQIVVPSTDPSMTGAQGMTVDPAGNIYVSQNAAIYEVPRNSNGTYGTSVSIATGLLNSATAYYYTASDLAVDGSGNIYVIITGEGSGTCSATSSPCPGIATIKSSIASPAGTGFKFVIGGSFANVLTHTPTSVTLDTAGDLFYADGTSVYEVTASSLQASSSTSLATPIAIGYTGTGTCPGCTAIATPNSVYLDKIGNVYVGETSGSKVAVIVNNGSAFSTSNATYLLPGTYSGEQTSGIAGVVDNQGSFVSPFGGSIERYGAGAYYLATSSNVFGGTQTVGTAGSSTSAKSPTFTYLFTASTTLNSTTPFAFINGGSAYGGAAPAQVVAGSVSSTTCTAGTTYTAGQTCNIEVGYKPIQPGTMAGAVVLYGASGNILNAATSEAIVAGPEVTFDPGIQAVEGKGYVAPAGVAVDGSGNMYVADPDANAVYEYAPGSTATGTAIGSGLSAPSGVAVDAAGNVYIADTGNNRVVVVPNYLAGLSTANQAAVATTGFALSSPRGVAVDAFGNLYIADTGNARVLMMANPFSGAVNTAPVTVGSGFTSPYAVAVDEKLNVYVADKGANSVVMVPGGYGFTTGTTNQGSGVQGTVGSGFSAPTGVAVDASGSVYVADGGNARVVRVPSISGVVPTSSTTPVVMYSGLNKPVGIATDLTGDIYFTDQTAPALYFIQRSAASAGTAATVAFGSVASGGSATRTATVTNSGYSTSLTLSSITAPASPFGETSNCTLPATLTAGSGCTLSLTYNPTSAGTSTPGTLTLTDTALAATAATQNISLTGDASGAVASVSLTGPSTAVYGDDATFTVTAKDSNGNPAVASSGTYSVGITGTATSSASVTLTNGTGSFFLPSVGVGTYNLSVTIGGFAGTASITLSKAPLYLTANNVSRLFDVANPTLASTYSGFANGDTSSVVSGTAPTISTTATRVSAYGTYPITLSGGSLTATNYTVSLINGNLSVTGSVPQAIIFPPLPNFTHGTTVTLTGQATSGLPVSYTVTGGTINGTTLTVGAAGTVTVTANQYGNSSYAGATPVVRSFTAQ